MDNQDFEMRLIAKCPLTVGWLKHILRELPDHASFGFRSMGVLDLYEIKHGNSIHIVFQDPKQPENEK